MVAEEAAVGLAQPVGDRAVVMAQQDVVAPVAVEVACARDRVAADTLSAKV
jgi:hypothetical protein